LLKQENSVIQFSILINERNGRISGFGFDKCGVSNVYGRVKEDYISFSKIYEENLSEAVDKNGNVTELPIKVRSHFRYIGKKSEGNIFCGKWFNLSDVSSTGSFYMERDFGSENWVKKPKYLKNDVLLNWKLMNIQINDPIEIYEREKHPILQSYYIGRRDVVKSYGQLDTLLENKIPFQKRERYWHITCKAEIVDDDVFGMMCGGCAKIWKNEGEFAFDQTTIKLKLGQDVDGMQMKPITEILYKMLEATKFHEHLQNWERSTSRS
jgi:hypothetical protein